MLLPPFASCLNLHAFQQSLLQILVSYIHAAERSMCRIEFEMLNGPPDLQYLGWW